MDSGQQRTIEANPWRLLRAHYWKVVVILVITGFIALLVWGMVQAGGRPGGFGIHSKPGEVKIAQRPAPPFQLELFDGRPLALEDLRGKLVMVDFWASWCPPCRQEALSLERVYQEYRSKGVEFVGIDVWDREEDARAFIRTFQVAYPNGPDNKLIAVNYGVTGIPEKYFISPSGVFLKKLVGPMDDEQLRQVLDGLLARPQ